MLIETDVVEACIKKGSRAQKKIFDTYKEIFMGIAMRYVKKTDLAQDVVQESFIKIFENISNLNDPAAFESWACRLVVNTAINAYKKKKSINRLIISENGQVDSSDDLQHKIIQKMDAVHLFKLINKMPEGYRIIFNMYLIDGFSHREIAGILGIERSTSRSQLSKAKRYLKSKIEESKVEFS